MMDNAAVHKAKKVKKTILRDYEWIPLYNEAYQPTFMPIENFFGLVKSKYRQLIVEDRKFDPTIPDKE